MKLSALAAIVMLTVTPAPAFADDKPWTPRVDFHLTARPWQPLNISRDAYLDCIGGICRFTVTHLGPKGEVIDPFLKREHQYSTPYFAFAVGTLVKAGRAKDLLPHGVAAMEHATNCVAGGRETIPDNHGEFFIPCLAGAIEDDHVFNDVLYQLCFDVMAQRAQIAGEQRLAGQYQDVVRVNDDGFESKLGSVRGNLYAGRASAGGEGKAIDCDGDGRDDVTFDRECRFVLQLRDGQSTAMEADRKVTASIGGKRFKLKSFEPMTLSTSQRTSLHESFDLLHPQKLWLDELTISESRSASPRGRGPRG